MFIYFDMGNVLLNFSHERMCRQISEVTGADPVRVREVVFESGLKERAEAGTCTRDEFYATLNEELKVHPDSRLMQHAVDDIFTVNMPVVPLLGHLRAAGYRLGLLSNVCESHWRFIRGERFGFVPELFSVLALSFEIGAVKPDPRTFTAAAELAGVAPEEIFYIDDIAANVDAARQAGFDAVQFTTADALNKDLRKRRIYSNF